jgi:hypothetical protein
MKVKRLALAAVLMASLETRADPPCGTTVSNRSVTIAAARLVSAAPAWAASTVITQGWYRAGVGDRVYMATTTGTTGATEPSHPSGEASDGGITWRRAMPLARHEINVVNVSTAWVYIAVAPAPAQLAKGIALAPSGGSWTSTSYQGEVRAIGRGHGLEVTVSEH